MNNIIENQSNDEKNYNFTYTPYYPENNDYIDIYSYSYAYNNWTYNIENNYYNNQYYPQSMYSNYNCNETYNNNKHESPNSTVQSEQSSGYISDINIDGQTNNTSLSFISSPNGNNSSVSISTTSQNLDSSFKRRRNHNQLPEEAVCILNEWFESHLNHPYPSMDEKHRLAEKCGIQVKQVNSWFCNRRNRSQNTKPKRIKRHLEQEITQVFNEFMYNPNKKQVMEKFKSTLKMHDIKL